MNQAQLLKERLRILCNCHELQNGMKQNQRIQNEQTM